MPRRLDIMEEGITAIFAEHYPYNLSTIRGAFKSLGHSYDKLQIALEETCRNNDGLFNVIQRMKGDVPPWRAKDQ